MIVGYAAGVFDLFHVGHLNLLRNAKALCDKLIVGVSTDELIAEYKHKRPVIPFAERCEVVRGIRHVDLVVAQETRDKFEAWRKLKYDVLFVGDDWFGRQLWEEMEARLKEQGVRIVYFPYTQGTSSTLINEILLERRQRLDREAAGAPKLSRAS